ncbi:MAG: hypothetical protein LIP02_05060 [Bacteroidales bacterium]|nr:hypothetical protein [Bacteroidales bacterium]
MKKILAIAAMAVIGIASAYGQDAEDLRVYLNPGHGSWTSNDRPMMTLREIDGKVQALDPGTKSGSYANSPDTTLFYETNTNLRKMYALLDRLVDDYGLTFDRSLNQDNDNPYRVGAALDLENNVVMSHVMAGPYPHDPDNANVCNRNLSEIAMEAEMNNFDMFISVHSNAASNDGPITNYLAFFYRGTNSFDYASGSKDMCQAAWPYVHAVEHQPWTARNSADVGQGVLGDVTFYGSSSTVNGYTGYLGVLKHGVPGYLAEGYFHTYQPSRQRAMNFDACRIEGYQYARGVAEYFELEKETTGEIYGVIRDLHKKFAHDYYKPNSNSQDVYKPLNGVTVTLSKDGQVVATKVTDNHYNGGFVFDNLEPGTYTLSYSHPNYKEPDADQPTTVTVEAATTVYPCVYLEAIDYVEGGITGYDDPLADIEGIEMPDQFDFNQAYIDEPIQEIAGKTIRRALFRNQYAYILAVDAENQPTLVVYDTKEKVVQRTVSTEGTWGTIMPLSSICFTAEGILLGCNMGEQPLDGDQNVEVYRWENDDEGLPSGNPTVLTKINHAGNWGTSCFGQSIAFSGTLDEGFLVMANQNTTSTGIRLEIIEYIEGQTVDYYHNNVNSIFGNPYNQSTLGNWQISVSPLASTNIVITSELMPPVELALNIGTSAGVPTVASKMGDSLVEGTAYNAGILKYCGHSLLVAPVVTADGFNALSLIDFTDGLGAAKLVTTLNTSIPAAQGNALATGGVVDVKRDGNGDYESSALNLLALRGDALLSRLTTEDLSGVENVVVAEDTDADAPVEYFNLQGQRIHSPAPGTIVIRRQGTTATKQLF